MDLARSTLKIFSGKGITVAINFVAIVYFARELGPTALGIYFLFEAVLRFSGLFADFGMGGALEKKISEGESKGVVYSSVLFFYIVSLSLVSALIYALRQPINNYIGIEISNFLIVCLIIYSMSNLQVKLLKGELRTGETAILEVSQVISWFIFGVLFISIGYGVFAIIYSYIIGLGLKFVIGIYKSMPSITRIDLNILRQLLHFARNYVLSILSRYAYNWIDILLIGYLLSSTEVGLYEVAWRVAGITLILSQAISTTIFPQFSNWYGRFEFDKIENLLEESSTWTTILVIPSFFGSLVLSRNILDTFFGLEYTDAWAVLIVLLLGKVFQSLLLVHERLLQALDQPALSARAAIIGAFSNLVLNYLLIQELELIGAAVATSLTYILTLLLHIYFSALFVQVRIGYKRITWVIVSSIIMVINIYMLRIYYEPTSTYHLIWLISCGIFIYCGALLLHSGIRNKIYYYMVAKL